MMESCCVDDVMTFENIDFGDPDLLKRASYKRRRSPVIVSLGQHPITTVDIQKLMEAGMNVVHLKLASTTMGDKISTLCKVEQATSLLCEKHFVQDWPISTCIELKTCMVNTGILEEDSPYITIKEGSYVTLTHNLRFFDRCNESKIFVDNPYLTADVKIGMEISIGQDEIIIVCKEILPEEKCIKGKVTKGGKLKNMLNVSARGANHSRPYITQKDMEIVKFALEYHVDMIIVYYVRNPDTITKIKQYIDSVNAKRPIIISGLCTEQGLNNVDDVIKVSDGVLFAREFIGYELKAPCLFKMAHMQKWVGAKCRQAGKPFYISGGVFQVALKVGTFYDNEISDVTNSLIDGVTGFVLKDNGNIDYTIEAIKSMNDICCAIEPLAHNKKDFWRIIDGIKLPLNAAEACVMSCVAIANKAGARVIILPTVTGQSAKALVTMRPSCLVITVSTNTRTTRLINTYRCCVPLLYTGPLYSKWHQNMNARVLFAIEYAVKRGWLGYGDTYVTLLRSSDTSSFCDCIQIWNVMISKKVFVECSDD